MYTNTIYFAYLVEHSEASLDVPRSPVACNKRVVYHGICLHLVAPHRLKHFSGLGNLPLVHQVNYVS